MSTVKSRLKEIIDAMGVKPYSLESTCEGVTKSMLQNLWNSQTDTVTSNILEPFCKAYPQVNCRYLLTGEGSMFVNEKSSGAEFTANDAELVALSRELVGVIGKIMNFNKGE